MTVIKMPVIDSLNTTTFPYTQKFDAEPAEPVDWRLHIGLESGLSSTLQAVCSGTLSTVPPNEVLGQEFGMLDTSSAPTTGVTRLYLQPDPQTLTGLSEVLAQAKLGDTLLWFLYANVDTGVPAAVITDALERLDAQSPSSTEIPNKLSLFLTGQAAVHVNAGDMIGNASPENAIQPGHFRAEFGVYTSHGYVDPVHFYNVAASLVEGDEESDVAALVSLVGTNWPFVARSSDLSELLTEAAQKLYPTAVLLEAMARLGVVSGSAEWRQVARAQKVLYLERLLNNTSTGTGPFFDFCEDEMGNPFQLEAIVEFFNFWKTPGSSSFPVLDGLQLSDLDVVNFTDQDAYHLVLIDPFNDARLGSPVLPKPDWSLRGYDLGADRNVCDSSVVIGADNKLAPDTFEGTLFQVHKGLVKRWDRWSSYTSHRWEDPETEKASCEQASSILGNLKYRFRSRYSPTRTVNYCFTVWYDGDDPDILSTRTGAQTDYRADAWTPGKYYFRAGIPTDGNGKTWLLIHFGHTQHDLIEPIDQEPDLQTYFCYSGSAGCIVSPVFHKFRASMCALFLQENPNDANAWFLKKVMAANTHTDSLILWDAAYIAHWQKEAWDERITGAFWLVHPDEPTQK